MHRCLPLVLIVALLVAFRFLGSAYSETLPNFQPLAALFFCGAWLAFGRLGWLVPVLAWLVTYPLPALLMGDSSYLSPHVFLTVAGAFAAVYFLGRFFKDRNVAVVLGGSVAAALLFHLFTNGAAWIGDPMYPKSAAGLWQSLWTGPVASPIPSWVFLRNMTLANLLFTGIVLAASYRIPAFCRKAESLPAR